MSPTNLASSLCSVCGIEVRKYKCPTCAVHYCSVNCFRAHKPGCQPSQSEVPAVTRPNSSTDLIVDPELYDLVDEKKLQNLSKQPSLVSALGDRRLQDILKSIDAATDRQAALDYFKKVEGKKFQDILDQILLAIGHADKDPVTGFVSFCS